MQSRLPKKHNLADFLSLYPQYRKKTRESTQNKFKYAIESAGSYLIGTTPTDDQLDQIVNEMLSEISTANDFNDFYQLIFTLREKAELAQSLKYAGDDSVLRGTLHALANLIICELAETEEFFAKVKCLKEKVK